MMPRAMIANLFLTQYASCGFDRPKVLSRYLLQVCRSGVIYHALIVSSSFDYWTLRYHLVKRPVELVICYHHDTLLNLPVYALDTGTWYDDGEAPYGYDHYSGRTTVIGSQVLLGGLLIGAQQAQNIVFSENFPRTTRYRYLRRLQQLQTRKRGRPVAS